MNDLDIADLYHAGSLFTEEDSNSRSPTTLEEDLRKDHHNNELSLSEDKLSQISRSLSSNSSEDNGYNSSSARKFSPEDIQERKEMLKKLLAKNFMPCTEKAEGVLELPGGIKITPPYTMESCDTKGNGIIQKKLGELIETMTKSM